MLSMISQLRWIDSMRRHKMTIYQYDFLIKLKIPYHIILHTIMNIEDSNLRSKIVSNIDHELKRMILASQADVVAKFNGSNPFILMQSYEIFLMSKDEQKEKKNIRKGYVNIMRNAKYMIAYFLAELVKEANNLTDNDITHLNTISVDDVSKQFIEQKYSRPDERNRMINEIICMKRMEYLAMRTGDLHDVSVVEFMYQMISRTKVNPMSNLHAAADPTSYFHSKIVQMMQNPDTMFTSVISTTFTMFLKALGKNINAMVCEEHRTVNHKVIASIFRMYDITQELRDILFSNFPPPTVTKKSKVEQATAVAPAIEV